MLRTGGSPGAGPAGGPPGRFQPGSGKALLRAFPYLRTYRRDAGGAFLALLLVSAANLASPLFIRLAIDRGLEDRERTAIVLAVVGLVGVALIRGVFSFLQGFLAERASQGVAFDLRNALFAHIERLSFAYYDRTETGQLLSRLTSDVEQVRGFVGTGIVQIAGAFVMLIGTIVLLLVLNWQLALVSLLPIPILLFLLLRFVTKIGPLFGRVQMSIARVNTVLQEDLTGVRVIRSFAREDFETARYGAANDDLLANNLAAVKVFSANFPLIFFFANLGTLAVVWYGGLEVIGNDLSIGDLVAFNTYLAFLLFPLLTIGFQAAGISRAGASALRVFEVLDETLTVVDRPGAVELPDATRTGRIPRRPLPLSRCGDGDAERRQLRRRAGADRRHPRHDRLGQEHDRQPDPALLRRHGRGGPDRRDRRPRRDAGQPAGEDRDRPPGDAALRRHGARQHRLRPTGRDPGGGRGRRPSRPGARVHRRHCPRATTRSSASAASGSPAVSGSGSRSRGRCWSIAPCSSSTTAPRPSTPPPNRRSRTRSTP